MDVLSYKLGQKSGGGGTTDYTQLENKPKINNVELDGNKTSEDLGLEVPIYIITDQKTEKDLENLNKCWNLVKAKKPFQAFFYNTDTRYSAEIYLVPIIFMHDDIYSICQTKYEGFSGMEANRGAKISYGFIYADGTAGEYTAITEIEKREFFLARTYSDSENQFPSLGALTVDNYRPFTPTEDYQPATKKYVDDNAGGEEIPFLIITDDNKNQASTIEKLNQIIDNLENSKPYGLYYQTLEGMRYITVPLTFGKNRFTSSYSIICPAILDKGSLDNNSNVVYCYQFSVNTSGNRITSITSITKTQKYIQSNGEQILTTNNTISYTPTGNYNPATKKYVDDLLTTYSGYDASKTQILKNINGVFTWVDE